MYNIENYVKEYNDIYKYDSEKSRIYVDLIINEIKCILEQETDRSYDNISLYNVCKYLKRRNEFNWSEKVVPCCNSNFEVELGFSSVHFIDAKYCPLYIGKFNLKYFFKDNYDKDGKKCDYQYDGRVISSNGSIRELINSSQEEIFKRVFVRIIDLPENYQENLRNIRKNELDIKINELINHKDVKIISKNKINFLKVVDKGLVKEENTNKDEISLYMIFKYLGENYEQFLKNKNFHQHEIQNILSVKYKNLPIIVTDLDFKDGEIKVKLDYYKNYFKEMSFAKKENEILPRVIDEPIDVNYINSVLKQKLLSLYNEDFVKFYLSDTKEKIKCVNAPFSIDIDRYGFKIYFEKGINDFKLDYSVLNKNDSEKKEFNLLDYQYDLLEEEILKNVYIKIDDTPSWMIDDLYKLRKESLSDSIFDRIRKFFR